MNFTLFFKSKSSCLCVALYIITFTAAQMKPNFSHAQLTVKYDTQAFFLLFTAPAHMKFSECVCRREYMGLIFAPLALTALLSLIVTLVWHDDIPQSLEAHEWANFTRKIDYALNGEDSSRGIVMFLLLVHALQTLFCLPLMHITKILYGYLLGVWIGCAVATVWEMSLVGGFVLFCARLEPAAPTPPLRKLLEYTLELRDSGRFYVFTMCVQLASIPLVTAAALVLYKIMTPKEFLASHLVVTFVMSLKDAWLGDFVARSGGETLDIFVIAAVFFVSTLLPTAVTVVLLGQVSRSALELVKEQQAIAGQDLAAKESSLSDSDSSAAASLTHDEAKTVAV